MPGAAAPEGQRTTQNIGGSSARPIAATQPSRSSSRSTVIGIGIVGALLTAVAVGGVIMATGPAPPPVVSAAAPVAAVAAAPVIAPVTALAPVAAPAQIAAPPLATGPAQAPVAGGDIAQTLARVLGPPQATPLNAPGQCEIGQVQQLSINLFASRRSDIGNVIRIHSGSYVSPPIVLTRSSQTVTFPAPPGSNGSARIIVEQSRANGGSTYEDDADNGITIEHQGRIDPYRDVDLIRWATPRC